LAPAAVLWRRGDLAGRRGDGDRRRLVLYPVLRYGFPLLPDLFSSITVIRALSALIMAVSCSSDASVWPSSRSRCYSFAVAEWAGTRLCRVRIVAFSQLVVGQTNEYANGSVSSQRIDSCSVAWPASCSSRCRRLLGYFFSFDAGRPIGCRGDGVLAAYLGATPSRSAHSSCPPALWRGVRRVRTAAHRRRSGTHLPSIDRCAPATRPLASSCRWRSSRMPCCAECPLMDSRIRCAPGAGRLHRVSGLLWLDPASNAHFAGTGRGTPPPRRWTTLVGERARAQPAPRQPAVAVAPQSPDRRLHCAVRLGRGRQPIQTPTRR